MVLTTGARLGAFEIIAPLGAGGMGEVYRGRDTKLDREVAIKVLPAAVAQDPERLARFEREAKVLAALNHPNIAQIYGVEESGGAGALVMELVVGVTLQCPLPIPTALDYAKQIAEALEAAHEKGVIHRDLKPGNIMVTPAGVVKVLDFGLAAIPGRDTSNTSDPANSPTITLAATQAGWIVGTAAYMSPEQAAGKPVDRRADIWSFGVVLFEMLTGTRLFEGETVSHTLADVLRAPIDFGKLPKDTPPAIRRLIERCLDRNVKNRLRDIGEARVTIDTIGKEVEPQPAAPSRARGSNAAWAAAGLFLLTTAALAFLHFREIPPAKPAVRFEIPLPEKSSAPLFELSPDGRTLAFTASESGRRRGESSDLWMLDVARGVSSRFTFRPGISGDAAWSPDGTRVAFEVGSNSIYQKSADGAGKEEQILAGGINDRPLDWSPDGKYLLFEQFGGITGADLWLLPLAGNRKPFPYLQTSFNEGDAQFSPDGRWVAYASNENGLPQVYVQSMPASGAKYQISGAGGDQPRWRRDGKELFYIAADEKLMAVPVKTGNSFEAGAPQALFEMQPINQPLTGRFAYQPSADGRRFLVVTNTPGAVNPPITIVLNWQAGMKR